ncbi:hypothetical protein EX30DRAFT_342291 [Ascodesmis nigricans]|uniref:Uncharacterized protein n=1 Tax=Ascodesmis nigricans TaxID=341454 RepID=A0A4S2MT63_9PEZI|nr:hypothetical protein EX30DRAFT_342291 [Ascodesmis nigricans]
MDDSRATKRARTTGSFSPLNPPSAAPDTSTYLLSNADAADTTGAINSPTVDEESPAIDSSLPPNTSPTHENLYPWVDSPLEDSSDIDSTDGDHPTTHFEFPPSPTSSSSPTFEPNPQIFPPPAPTPLQSFLTALGVSTATFNNFLTAINMTPAAFNDLLQTLFDILDGEDDEGEEDDGMGEPTETFELSACMSHPYGRHPTKVKSHPHSTYKCCFCKHCGPTKELQTYVDYDEEENKLYLACCNHCGHAVSQCHNLAFDETKTRRHAPCDMLTLAWVCWACDAKIIYAEEDVLYFRTVPHWGYPDPEVCDDCGYLRDEACPLAWVKIWKKDEEDVKRIHEWL